MIISFERNISKIKSTIFGAAHTERYSIFGPDGFKEFLEEHSEEDVLPIYGNYAFVKKSGNKVTISTDHFGLYKIYIYQSGCQWAVSDSFYELVKFAKKRGWSVDPYPTAAYAFFLPGGLGHQLSSYKTPIHQIELIPHWLDIIIDEFGVTFQAQKSHFHVQNLEEAIQKSGSFFASLLKSYQNNNFFPVMTLSGGLDSRCTLAAMLSHRYQNESSKIEFWVNKQDSFKKDRAISQSLAMRLHLREAQTIPNRRRPTWNSWKTCFLGVQSHFAPYPRPSPNHPVFSGACAEAAKMFYDWGGALEGINFPAILQGEIGDNIKRDISEALQKFYWRAPTKIPLEIKHYQMFRNRFHFERNIFDSIFNFPPLVYSLLDAINTESQDPKAPNSFHRLIFEFGGRSLLDHPFDDERKAFKSDIPANWVDRRLFENEIADRELFYGAKRAAVYDDLAGTTAEADDQNADVEALYGGLSTEGREAVQVIRSEHLVCENFLKLAERQINDLDTRGAQVSPNGLRGVLAALSLHMAFQE